jgi:CTP synthase (UTP-ammonia lyase)
LEIEPNINNLPGIVMCGTHSPENVEELIEVVSQCRLTKTPYLGICFGHQLAAIEHARNVGGIEDATSEEFGEGTFVVKKMPKLKVGLHDGETYWHQYEVDYSYTRPKNYFTSQFHPEYQSSKDRPHPLLVGFIEYAKMAM